MNDQKSTYIQLQNKLQAFRSTEKRFFLYKRLIKLVLVIAPLIALLTVIEMAIDLSVNVRLALSWGFISIGILGFIAILFKPVYLLLKRDQPTLNEIALKVGSHYKTVDDRLANALQLFQRYHNDDRYSISLINEALNSVRADIADQNFYPLVNKKPFFKLLKTSALVFSVFVLLIAIKFPDVGSAITQLLHPKQDMDTNQITFKVFPGNTRIVEDSEFDIKVWVSDSTLQTLDLTYTGKSPIPLEKSSDDTFRYQIDKVYESFTYQFMSKEQVSPEFTVDVEERPLLRNISVTVTPPAYSGIDKYALEDNVGDVSALKGSRINIVGKPNKELDTVRVEFSDNELYMDKKNDKVYLEFPMKKSDIYRFFLTDMYGFSSINPITYNLQVIPDQYPVVRIIQPGKDIDLGEEMLIPLIIDAQDDYGVDKISIAYQVISAEMEPDSNRYVHQELVDIDYEQKMRVALNWDLSESDMLPTEVVVYYVEAWDNDSVSGPKRSVSKTYRARFPSMFEMYEEITSTQDEAIREMEDAYEKSQEFKEKIDELSREMQREKDLDWERQQETEQALQQREEINQKLKELEKNLEEMVDKMEENDLVSSETLKKYQELQELYKDIMTPELENLMKQMSESLQNVDQNMLKKAMEEFKMTEDQMSKNLDRTINLLKRLKMEQQLDQAIKMANDIAERQQNLENKQGDDKNRLSKEQSNINKDKEAMTDALKELRKEMEEQPQMPLDQMDKALSDLESDSLDQAFNEMQEMINSGQMENFSQQSKKVQQKMESIAQQLQQAKDNMNGTMQRQAMMAMKRNIRQLLELSLDQEDLMMETEELPSNASNIQSVADRQNNMNSGLSRVINSIFELSKETMSMNSQMQATLGNASMNMQDALTAMENRNNKLASRNQAEAMKSINSAILQMQQSMQNMMQNASGSGMSFEQFMQQMQKMAQGQQQLNQMTQQVGMGQQMSQAQQAQMARMAAEQERLRKSMEQLAQEAGGMKEVMGDLDNIAKDMKEVEKDFNSQNISRETLQRQNRILSRMLDAQRSIRQREYSRKRKAQSGKNYMADSPPELPQDMGERKSLLQQELLNAKQQGFSQDYLELIKQYFEALTEQEQGRQ